jgi:hypothetical protein
LDTGGQHQRNDRGQFARGADNGQGNGTTRVYATDLDDANRRIGELMTESGSRRRENKMLTEQMSAVQQRQVRVDQRAMRMEAREALRARRVIDPDVVDLFLKHAGDKIKIDETTGDVIGVDPAADEFSTAKPQFFKPADNANAGNSSDANTGAGDTGSSAGSAAGASGDAADTRGNATGTGASIAGGGSGTGGQQFKIGDFRDPKVNPQDLLAKYARSKA